MWPQIGEFYNELRRQSKSKVIIDIEKKEITEDEGNMKQIKEKTSSNATETLHF